jgi:hypothetical protein
VKLKEKLAIKWSHQNVHTIKVEAPSGLLTAISETSFVSGFDKCKALVADYGKRFLTEEQQKHLALIGEQEYD